MSDKAPEAVVSLEYIGPHGQDWFSPEGEHFKLVAGQRYPVPVSLADYFCKANASHWKRPDGAAAKE